MIPPSLLLLLFSLLIDYVPAQQELVFQIRNPIMIPRKGEAIVVRWETVRGALPSAQPTTIGVHDLTTGAEVACQAVDLDQDGTPDELVFHADVSGGETKSFALRMENQPRAPLAPLTDARFMTPREDLAWENDRVAFRMYGPALAKEVGNGIDVWTKRVRSLIVEKWYKGDESKTASYHIDHGEGADFFSVGWTLGCGGSSLWTGDSLIQPGVFVSSRVIAAGPLRAVFELKYNAVRYGKEMVSEVKRITLDAGQNLNKIEVTYKGESGSVAFAAGIVKRPNVKSTVSKSNKWAALYGLTTANAADGFLGTGVILTGSAFKEIREDSLHVLMIGSATIDRPVVYYSGAGWTRSGDFAGKKDWEVYLEQFARRLERPVEIIVKTGKK
jgi:pectinesterase